MIKLTFILTETKRFADIETNKKIKCDISQSKKSIKSAQMINTDDLTDDKTITLQGVLDPAKFDKRGTVPELMKSLYTFFLGILCMTVSKTYVSAPEKNTDTCKHESLVIRGYKGIDDSKVNGEYHGLFDDNLHSIKYKNKWGMKISWNSKNKMWILCTAKPLGNTLCQSCDSDLFQTKWKELKLTVTGSFFTHSSMRVTRDYHAVEIEQNPEQNGQSREKLSTKICIGNVSKSQSDDYRSRESDISRLAVAMPEADTICDLTEEMDRVMLSDKVNIHGEDTSKQPLQVSSQGQEPIAVLGCTLSIKQAKSLYRFDETECAESTKQRKQEHSMEIISGNCEISNFTWNSVRIDGAESIFINGIYDPIESSNNFISVYMGRRYCLNSTTSLRGIFDAQSGRICHWELILECRGETCLARSAGPELFNDSWAEQDCYGKINQVSATIAVTVLPESVFILGAKTSCINGIYELCASVTERLEFRKQYSQISLAYFKESSQWLVFINENVFAKLHSTTNGALIDLTKTSASWHETRYDKYFERTFMQCMKRSELTKPISDYKGRRIVSDIPLISNY